MSIELTVEGGVAVITISRPERKNAITLEMRDALVASFERAQADDDIRVVVLTGAGADFSAGADIGQMEPGVAAAMGRMRRLHKMVRSVARTEKPVIAAVQGVCIGMSWAMALACDMVIAAEDARFQFAFRHLGLGPDGGAAFLLARHVPLQRAKEIIYSGRFVSGAEAASLGLALEAVPAAEVLERAMELARGFAVAPTLALALAKRQFDAAPAQTYDMALDFEANTQALAGQTEDFQEGVAAFKEKRKSAFKGR
jgi:2-(1,2-epoxy-1,2-dihydrophenyl)acetyl-CoA isomerase